MRYVRIGHRECDMDDPKTMPIGYISAIPVWADNLAEAFNQCVGSPPCPPWLEGPGQMLPTYTPYTIQHYGSTYTTNVITGYSYDQGPADYNKSAIDLFVAEETAWKDNRDSAKMTFDIIVEGLKK